MTTKEIMNTLEGNEILSIKYEGVVAINNGYICTHNRKFKPTHKQAVELLHEAFYDEFGTNNVEAVLKSEGLAQ